jgi:hypothetical protein
MPTWVWYVAGAGIFVLVYLYLQSSQSGASNPVGQTATVPSTGDLAAYGNITDSVTQILTLQQLQQTHMATSTGTSNASTA